MSEKNEKLKFKDEETVNEITEETPPVPISETDPDSLTEYIFADEPPDEKYLNTPAETDDGGETPEDDVDENNISNPDADVTDELADTAESKLYDRESSLKFTSDKPAVPAKPTEKPVKKRQRVFGIMEDTTSHDNLINKPLVSDEPRADQNGDNGDTVNEENSVDTSIAEPVAGTVDGEKTPDADITENNSNNNNDDNDNSDNTAQTSAPPINTAIPSAVPVVAPAVVPALKSAKPVKPVKPVKSKLQFSKDEKPKT